MTASVTQAAPSVWPTPESATTAAGAASAPASDSTTLPGLSPDCSAAIRAQLAVNKLFVGALAKHTTTAASTPSGTIPATATATLTADAVGAVFDPIDSSVPEPLKPDFATLRAAAEKAVGKPAADIPAILDEKDVTAANRSIARYITACSPPASAQD